MLILRRREREPLFHSGRTIKEPLLRAIVRDANLTTRVHQLVLISNGCLSAASAIATRTGRHQWPYVRFDPLLTSLWA
jgi:hypothetical protein